jgi:hypothetical protein
MRPSQARARIDIASPGPPRACSDIARSHGAGAEQVQGFLAGLGGRGLAACCARGFSATDTVLGSNVAEDAVMKPPSDMVE